MHNIALLVSWNLLKVKNQFYIGGMHYTYIQYVAKRFDKVFLISSVRLSQTSNNQLALECFDNVEVVELPAVDSYVGALCNYKYYCRAIAAVRPNVDFFYCRVPDPFCWLPRLKYETPSIMHFVGDTIDATMHNEKWSWLHKVIMICGYLPEYFLTLKSARHSKVYTNGQHIRNKLSKYHISATAVISSTVSYSDLKSPMRFRGGIPPRMIYVGYLRFAKGMNLLKKLWLILKKKWPDFKFDLVGNGEMENEIKEFIIENNLSKNIVMHGSIDNRGELKKIMQNADLFVFPSLSEGSPRVIIEAMGEGLPVISTPVGSLPHTFIDKDTIRYFDFNNVDQAYSLIQEYCLYPKVFEEQRNKAFLRVKTQFTIENFLSQVFFYK